MMQDLLKASKEITRESRYTKDGVKKRYPGPAAASLVCAALGYKLAGKKGIAFSVLATSVGGAGTLYNGIKSGVFIIDKDKI